LRDSIQLKKLSIALFYLNDVAFNYIMGF